MVLRSFLYFRVAHFSFVGNGIVVFVPQLLGHMMLEMGIIMSNKTNDVEFWPTEPKTRVDPSTHTRPSFSLEILSGHFRLQRTNTSAPTFCLPGNAKLLPFSFSSSFLFSGK
ncbi:hypothetical protein ACFX10_030696 [Malus domestica]